MDLGIFLSPVLSAAKVGFAWGKVFKREFSNGTTST